MSTQPYVSEIQLFSFGFAPQGWAFCNGQVLPINQNQSLFTLLGTTYGGNGVTTFALPDLRGRVPMGVSSGHSLGEAGGAEAVTITTNEMPGHVHAISVNGLTGTPTCKNGAADKRTPVGTVSATDASGTLTIYSSAAPNAMMTAGAVAVGGTMTASPSGGNLAHENRQPLLALSYCIALTGIYPSQS